MTTQWTLSRPQMELEESVVRRRAAVRTLGQQVLVWSLRTLINLLVLGLLGAAFYGIYWATGYTVQLQVRRARGFDPEISQYMGINVGTPGPLQPLSSPTPLSLSLPPGELRDPAVVAAKAGGGLPAFHLHLRGQLSSASCVQTLDPAGGLYPQPPDHSHPPQVSAFPGWVGLWDTGFVI